MHVSLNSASRNRFSRKGLGTNNPNKSYSVPQIYTLFRFWNSIINALQIYVWQHGVLTVDIVQRKLSR